MTTRRNFRDRREARRAEAKIRQRARDARTNEVQRLLVLGRIEGKSYALRETSRLA